MTSFNWTTPLAEQAMALYTTCGKDNTQLESIAQTIGTTIPSVRGKLAIMGVYAKDVKATKAGSPKATETKSETLRAIEIMLSITSGDLASLDKGTVKSIGVLFNALKQESASRHAQLGLKES